MYDTQFHSYGRVHVILHEQHVIPFIPPLDPTTPYRAYRSPCSEVELTSLHDYDRCYDNHVVLIVIFMPFQVLIWLLTME